MWWKPALATAAVVLLSLSFLFFPSENKQTISDNYLIVENEYFQTEAIEVSEEHFTNLENSLLQEIYDDPELRDEILTNNLDYFSGNDYEAVLSNQLTEDEIEFLKKEIEKMRAT